MLINFTAELVAFLTLLKLKKYCKYGRKVKHFGAVKAVAFQNLSLVLQNLRSCWTPREPHPWGSAPTPSATHQHLMDPTEKDIPLSAIKHHSLSPAALPCPHHPCSLELTNPLLLQNILQLQGMFCPLLGEWSTPSLQSKRKFSLAMTATFRTCHKEQEAFTPGIVCAHF